MLVLVPVHVISHVLVLPILYIVAMNVIILVQTLVKENAQVHVKVVAQVAQGHVRILAGENVQVVAAVVAVDVHQHA